MPGSTIVRVATVEAETIQCCSQVDPESTVRGHRKFRSASSTPLMASRLRYSHYGQATWLSGKWHRVCLVIRWLQSLVHKGRGGTERAVAFDLSDGPAAFLAAGNSR